ncbi:hypothetical protein Tco_0421835 [Tanacetum coccineum]
MSLTAEGTWTFRMMLKLDDYQCWHLTDLGNVISCFSFLGVEEREEGGEDAQARKRFEEEQAIGSILHGKELLGADVNEGNFIERMTAVKERKKRALADLRYRALKGKPLKKSEDDEVFAGLSLGIVVVEVVIPKSSVHVLDLTNGKTVYMFVDKVYPIRATLLERMLRHRLTVPPSYCRDVVVAGNIIQTVQAGLRQAYEYIASAPIQERVWLTLQTGLSKRVRHLGKDLLKSVDGCQLPKPGLVCIFLVPVVMKNDVPMRVGSGLFVFTQSIISTKSELAIGKDINYLCCCKDWKLDCSLTMLFTLICVHRVYAVSFDAAVLDAAATVSAACIIAAGYIVSAGICDAAGSFVLADLIYICCLLCFCCYSILLLHEDLSRNLMLSECQGSVHADYVFADYGPWLGNDGVIFFEEKIRCILVRLSEVELRLIALNAELQVFHSFSDNNVPNPHVDCVEHVNFVRSR